MVDVVQSGNPVIDANFPIQVGTVQNPYRPFTYTLAPGAQETIYYNFNYFRILSLVGGEFSVKFGGTGADAVFPGAGLAYEAPVVLERVTIRNTGVTPMTFTVALAVGRVLDDRLQYSGSVQITNDPSTPIYIAQGTGVILDVKAQQPSAFSTAQISVGTSSTLIKAATPTRKSIVITAPSTGDLYVGATGVTTATGVRVPAGSTISMESTAAIYGVLAVAATATYLEETY